MTQASFGMRVLALQRGDDRCDRRLFFPDVGDPLGNRSERYYTSEQPYDLLHVCNVVLYLAGNLC